ncbi:hypothetical protein C8039_17715 [Halogeometricum sp. wsp3]|nr:hypothetical protein C8039_17715 [Halogeometricum sp. wsp3]
MEILDDTAALELIRHEGRVHGAMLESDGEVDPYFAGSVVLATGGIGDLYPRTTNPDNTTGDGIGMAALAGAEVEDMEYVQFHPTAVRSIASHPWLGRRRWTAGAGDVAFLVSEAVRGEGGLLRNGKGERFMPDYHADAELAPRDVVARAVKAEREATGEVTLDVSPLDFAEEFPNLADRCKEHGIDWTDGIPVAPAEHFLCGGIDVDDRGRTTLDRLYAVGRVRPDRRPRREPPRRAVLLEGLVWGLRAGGDAAGADPEPIETPEPLDTRPGPTRRVRSAKYARLPREMDGRRRRARRRGPRTRDGRPPAAERRGRRLRPHANQSLAVRTPQRERHRPVDRAPRRRKRGERRHAQLVDASEEPPESTAADAYRQ